MNLGKVKRNLDGIARLCFGIRLDTRGNRDARDAQVEVNLRTHQLGNVDVSLDDAVGRPLQELRLVVYVFRADAANDFLTDIGIEIRRLVGGQLNVVLIELQRIAAAALRDCRVDKVPPR